MFRPPSLKLQYHKEGSIYRMVKVVIPAVKPWYKATVCCRNLWRYKSKRYSLPQNRPRRPTTLSLSLTLNSVGVQDHAPAAFLPGKTRYQLYRWLGVLQGRFGAVRKISPPLGFVPQTVQPVANRYTDRVIPAHFMSVHSALHIWHAVVFHTQGTFHLLHKIIFPPTTCFGHPP